MTIKYSDGKTVEAVLLARSENTMRVAIEGADDVMEFTNIGGAWVSEDCEPVSIVFAWQRPDRKKPISVTDCICSRELADRLIHSLFAEKRDDATPTLHVEEDVPVFATGAEGVDWLRAMFADELGAGAVM